MIYFSNIKINIGLNVCSKRQDGYHEISSVFYPIQWCDLLEVTQNEEDRFAFSSSGLHIPGELEDNLVFKTYQLIKEKYSIGGVKVHLRKQIPMGAGLGGGSSNAGFMLKALNDLFDLKLTDKELIEFALNLGSDVPFFVKNQPMLCSGRGEIMQPIELDLKGYFIALINPEIHVSTKDAFEGIIPNNRPVNLEAIKEIHLWKDEIVNDFEATIFEKHPKIEEVKNKLYRQGAIYASMSGSGSTVYGIFKEKPSFEADFIGMI